MQRTVREIALVDVGGQIDAGAVRAQQLREVISLTPWMMLGALANCSILVAHFWFTQQGTSVAIWATVIALFAGLTLRKWHPLRDLPPKNTASKRSVIRAIRHAAILGVLWGILPIVVAGSGRDTDWALPIITIVGMSASGSFVLAVLPAAALAHLGVMLLPSLIAYAIGQLPMSVALVILTVNYFVVMTIIILVRYREFLSRLYDRQQVLSQAAALAASIEETRRAAEAATEATRIKSQFLAKMSHEIRTPMNGILGMGELLERSDLTERQRSLVGTINYSGKSLLTIINDILDFSRIEAGHLSLDRHSFEVHRCIEAATGLLVEVAERKGLRLTTTIGADVPATAIGDDGRLRQILINLIGNAVKFTERGSVHVEVELESIRDDGHVVRYCIRDTGIGIAPSIKAQLFKPFEQGDSSITRKFGGTGLGLSITESLVEAMGGQIQIDSEVGTGTTVTFAIELGRADAHQSERQPVGPAIEKAQANFAGLSVLVAEDNPVNRAVVAAYLERLGCRAHVVDDGDQALAALRSERFDIVLMDCQMPVMDGFAATRILRAKEAADKSGRTPVIAVTANAYASDRDECLSAGMDDFLSKPFREDELADMLKRWGRMGARPAAAAA